MSIINPEIVKLEMSCCDGNLDNHESKINEKTDEENPVFTEKLDKAIIPNGDDSFRELCDDESKKELYDDQNMVDNIFITKESKTYLLDENIKDDGKEICHEKVDDAKEELCDEKKLANNLSQYDESGESKMADDASFTSDCKETLCNQEPSNLNSEPAVFIKEEDKEPSDSEQLKDSNNSQCEHYDYSPNQVNNLRPMDRSCNDEIKMEDNVDSFDMAYIVDMLSTPAAFQNEVIATENTESVMEASENEDLLARASRMLGKKLEPIDSDTNESDGLSKSSSEDSSCSSTSSSSSSSSESSDEEDQANLKDIINKMEEELIDPNPPKTKDEIFIEDLPEEAELKIDLPDDASLNPAGQIQSLVEQLIVIKGVKGCPALDAETIFFKKDRKPFGKVFDVFGPVQNPFYAIRVKKQDALENLGLNIGEEVYYAPNYLNVTNYVFLEQLKKMKGSDASWNHDQEPPSHCVDYSDDEEEAKAKSAAKKKRQLERKKLNEDDEDADAEDDVTKINRNKTKKNNPEFVHKKMPHKDLSQSHHHRNIDAGFCGSNNVVGGKQFNVQQDNMNEESLPFFQPLHNAPHLLTRPRTPILPPGGGWPRSLTPRFNPRPFRPHLGGDFPRPVQSNPPLSTGFDFEMYQNQLRAPPRPPNTQSFPPRHGYRFPPKPYSLREEFDPRMPPPFPRHMPPPDWRPPF